MSWYEIARTLKRLYSIIFGRYYLVQIYYWQSNDNPETTQLFKLGESAKKNELCNPTNFQVKSTDKLPK
jgi:hypothetical protein